MCKQFRIIRHDSVIKFHQPGSVRTSAVVPVVSCDAARMGIIGAAAELDNNPRTYKGIFLGAVYL